MAMIKYSNRKGDIIAVDDSPTNLQILRKILTEIGYKVRPILNGTLAIKAALASPPDLILLDVNMPDMNGFDVCKLLKQNEKLKDIPVIFISGLTEISDKIQAFEVGGVDYIAKPFRVEEVTARVDTHINLRNLQKELERHNKNLEKMVQVQVQEISDLQLAIIFAMASMAECRDFDTGIHLERTRHYCRFLAKKLMLTDEYGSEINDNFVKTIFETSPLHDIGKVGIPDYILLKPGKLTADEFEIMKTHSAIGSDALKAVMEQYPKHGFIEMGIQITRHHHERWDGKGYPDGLIGKDIPLSARIMTIIDVYDALTSRRVYKEPIPHEESCKIIQAGKGTQFDPFIVEVFMKNKDEIFKIKNSEN